MQLHTFRPAIAHVEADEQFSHAITHRNVRPPCSRWPLEKPVAERAAFLQAVCGADSALRQRLEALLAAHDQPDDACCGARRRDDCPTVDRADDRSSISPRCA